MKPNRIILVRHGESESNENCDVLRSKPDFSVNLTEVGLIQSGHAGHRIARLSEEAGRLYPHYLNDDCWFYVSPYHRTRQTLKEIEKSFAPGRVKVFEDPRLREQDRSPWVLKGEPRFESEIVAHTTYRNFYFRFDGGESCADVCDRVESFREALFRDFEKNAFPLTCCLVGHSTVNRLFLMCILKYTIEEFERLPAQANGGIYVLNLQSNGKYALHS